MSKVTRLVSATALLAGSVLVLTPDAHADINYDASAAANAFDLTLANESIPLGMVPEAEGPLAQAHQTSLDTSDAFAAFPYPGDTAAQLPGLVGGLIGVPVPPYPLAVQTSNGDKPKAATYPGIELTAQSTDIVTQAHAVAGSPASGGVSSAQVLRSGDGAVSATATGDANGLAMSGVVTISGMHAEASARRDADGTLSRSGHLSFAHLMVPGLSITIPRSTPTSVPVPVPLPVPMPTLPPFPAIPLPMGGQTLPAPDLAFRDGQFAMTIPGLGSRMFAVPAQAALDALAAAGVKAEYQAGRTTPDGVVSPGLVLTTVLPAPPQNPAGVSGTTTVTMTFGLATASVSGSVLPNGAVTPPLGNGPALTPPALMGNTPVTPIAGGPGAYTDLPPNVAGSDQSGSSPLQALQLTRLGKAQDLGWLYLLFVASALMGFGSTTVLRHLGVRVRWSS